MDKLFDSPWLLRFTALFLAILLFYTVKFDEGKLKENSSTEEMEVIRNIPVEVYYDNENLIVTGVPETVNVMVDGPANLVKTIKLLKDFTLFVDLRSLTMGEHQVAIQYENISDKLNVRIDPEDISVKIEEKITETFRIEPEFNERLLAEGYKIVNMAAEPSTIEVTGAKSVIEAINFVKATISADAGIHESFEQSAKVRVLDRDLNKLDISIFPENVNVKVEIQENAKEVPIVLNEKGTPPDGVKINSITSATDKIVLSGPNRILKDIESFPVDVDVSKITKSGTIDVKLVKPEEIFSLSANTIKVQIDASVDDSVDATESEPATEEVTEEVATTEEEITIEDIEVEVTGLNNQFTGTIIQPQNGKVSVTVKGPIERIRNLKKTDFTASIDASDASAEGESVYPIHVKGPADVEWKVSSEEATLKIVLA